MNPIDSFQWYAFHGAEVPGRLLQSVCEFRSAVLFDNGFRKNYDQWGANYGDISHSDFESIHIVAAINQRIAGTVRITLPSGMNTAMEALGPINYERLLKQLKTNRDSTIEINRLMIDSRIRKSALGQTLMHASIGYIEAKLNREKLTIIGSAGNCLKQTQFFLKHTDYKRVQKIENVFCATYNDEISFLVYGNRPYQNGRQNKEYFLNLFQQPSGIPFNEFIFNNEQTSKNLNREKQKKASDNEA